MSDQEQHVYTPRRRKVSPLVFLAAALLVALIFAAVPFVSFLLRAHRSGDRADQIVYAESAPPPPPPELPPRATWTNEKPQPLTVPEMESEPLDLEFGLLDNAHLPLSVPSSAATISTEAFLLDAANDWQVFNQDELQKGPKARNSPRPEYPENLRNKGIVGEVWVHFVIDENGVVKRPYVGKSTNDGFNAAALEAVSKWTFDPGLKDGSPVKSRAVVPIEFNLEIQLPE